MEQEINQQNEVVKVESEEKLPLGIKIISILFFIFPVLILFTVFSASSLNLPNPTNYGYSSNLYEVLNKILITLSFIVAILGIFLWKKQNWARILVIVSSLLISVNFLFSFITSLFFLKSVAGIFLTFIPLIITSSVFFYLSFSKKVKLAFNPERKFQIKDILISIGVFIGLFVLFGFLYSSLSWNSNNPTTNPYNWKAVTEPTDLEFKKILSYKFSNGLEKLSWTEEANGGWKVTDSSKVVYERWLKTIYGYPPSDKPVFKIYLEGISADTFENYLTEVEKEISGKTNYANAWYSLSWNENNKAETLGESYIIFPDRKLGVFLIFYNQQSLTKQEAEKIIQELIDHIVR